MAAAATTAGWTAGAATTLTTGTATLVSALFVPLLTSRNERSTAAVRHMQAVSRNGQYCCRRREKKILGEKIMKNTLYIQLKIIDLKKEDEKNIEYLNAFTTEKKINDFMSWKDINEIKEFSEEEKKMFHDNTNVVYRDGIMDISIPLLENNFIKQIEVITKSISYVVAKLAMLGSFIEGTMDLDKRQDEKLEQIGICLSESCKEKVEKNKLEYLKNMEIVCG
ncbi:hypothetical protein HNP77_001597 [Treponema rectale]|uniref:Uncharacterized protein n=2 Tax=Treponema rectale TaxID=744512 RepID=A0A840SGE0_9SPIR|nr:hypothetical protein [Treponema rectale]MBB5219228.1 hypothetical protein [Treponema rectale]